MSPTAPTPALVSAAAAGDPSAFAALVDRYRGVVTAITLAATWDPRTSEDVAQDVFLAAWRGLPRLRDPSSFGPWIRQLARNQSRQALRASGRYARRVTLDPGSVQRAPDGTRPDVSLLQAEEAEALADALAALPDDTREVLILFYREDRSVKQVAALLELSEAAVRQRLSRGRRRLRDAVAERLDGLLQRTTPGAAFTALVLTAIAGAPQGAQAASTQQARAATRSGLVAWLGGLSLLSLLALLALALGPCGGHPTGVPVAPAAPPPAQTERARQASAPALPTPEPEPTIEIPEPVSLRIPLGDPAQLHRNFVLLPAVPASSWFPLDTEAPLPDTEAAGLLQDKLDDEASGAGPRWQGEATRALLQAAASEGLLDPPLALAEHDPWRALLALELMRRGEYARFHAAAADEDGVILYYDRDTPLPERQLEPLEALADALADAWPDESVGTYAALYQVYAVQERHDSDEQTVEQLLELALDGDDVLSTVALAALPQSLIESGAGLQLDELRRLRGRLDHLPEGPDRSYVSLYLLEHAVALGDDDEIVAWLSRAEEVAPTACPHLGPSHCPGYLREVAIVLGQLADRIGRQPTSWEEGLVVATLRCRDASGLPADALAGTVGATWTGGAWRWAPLEAPTPLQRCLTTAQIPGPPPAEGTRVQLEIYAM